MVLLFRHFPMSLLQNRTVCEGSPVLRQKKPYGRHQDSARRRCIGVTAAGVRRPLFSARQARRFRRPPAMKARVPGLGNGVSVAPLPAVA
jgi:hypothetical protein